MGGNAIAPLWRRWENFQASFLRSVAMFLTNPQRSPADLNFRIFDIPVRVHPLFWVMGVFIGFHSLERGIANLLVWVGCMFVSVLVHELGHVVTARMFGVWSEIVLYGLGGLAIQSSRMRNRWQHILVCLAGPGAGFLFLGLMLLCLPLAAPQEWPFIKNVAQYWLGLAPLDPDLRPEKFTIVWEMFWA